MKYIEMLNTRTPQQIIKHAEIKERVVRSVMLNSNVLNKDSILQKRITDIITIKKSKDGFKKLFK